MLGERNVVYVVFIIELESLENLGNLEILKILKILNLLTYILIAINKTTIRITDSFSFDYADSPYHIIILSPSSYGLSADTFSNIPKSPQNSIACSFLPENQYSLLN